MDLYPIVASEELIVEIAEQELLHAVSGGLRSMWMDSPTSAGTAE